MLVDLSNLRACGNGHCWGCREGSRYLGGKQVLAEDSLTKSALQLLNQPSRPELGDNK